MFAIVAIALAGSLVSAQAGDFSTALSAKKKQARPHQRQQIACTFDGCHPIPANCHPEIGYGWDGIPTGFDIVVCRSWRDRRR